MLLSKTQNLARTDSVTHLCPLCICPFCPSEHILFVAFVFVAFVFAHFVCVVFKSKQVFKNTKENEKKRII